MKVFLHMAVIGLSLLLINACSSPTGTASALEAIRAEGIYAKPIDSPKEAELDGVSPISYELDNREIIRIYEFASKAERESGKQRFQEHQQLLSSYSPIMYETEQYFILYYSQALSKTSTPKHNETKYGEKLQKAFEK